MFGSEGTYVEIADTILGDRLVGIVLAYLEESAPRYCVVVSVYKGKMEGENYIGRFVITLDEIAIEDTLAATWSKKVKSVAIDES